MEIDNLTQRLSTPFAAAYKAKIAAIANVRLIIPSFTSFCFYCDDH